MKLVTWSSRTTHLYLDEPVSLSNGVVVPKGVLCKRKPIKAKFKMSDGRAFKMLTVEFGEANRYFRMWFCKDCQRKAVKFHTDRVADELGLPE